MNSKTRALLFGGLIGALLGVLAGWLYFNANVLTNEEGQEQLGAPTPATSLKWGLGLLSVLRQITE
ncbi:MAG TPA: hypothetical protein PKH77_05840 [Anaerolineae bacterium]|nr:hypothetical protein [Anaerolineae bacterium]